MPYMRPATDAPIGFVPYSAVQRIRPYLKDASAPAIYTGDAVILDNDGGVGIGAASSTTYLGVAAEYSPASTAKQDFLVYDDPEQLFYVQDDGDTTHMAQTEIGLNADIVATTGDTSLLRSKHEIDSSTAATTAGLAVKIMALHEMESGSFATAAGSPRKWVVKFNAHIWSDITGQLGV